MNIDSIKNTINMVDLLRIRANGDLNPEKKGVLGQYFTPAAIAKFMASLFINIRGNVRLLDPGCGVGSLTSSFFDEAIRRDEVNSIYIEAYDIEKKVIPYIEETIKICTEVAKRNKLALDAKIFNEDFILKNTYKYSEDIFTKNPKKFTHAILNPPYKKISSNSKHRKALNYVGIQTVNLYSGFLALSIKMLCDGGELVAIIPRSFTNGSYYQSFREFLLSKTALKHIHIFETRDRLFPDDGVLQENVILHCIKGKKSDLVSISSSNTADFKITDEDHFLYSTADMKYNEVSIEEIIHPSDKQKFIHISLSNYDKLITDRLSSFRTSLFNLGLTVSTGPIVDFRQKEFLRKKNEAGAVPVIYPIHLNNTIDWPKNSKRPNYIINIDETKSLLWKNSGFYVIVKRFSSKDEKRRIVASLYDSSTPSNFIGFENKLNIYHIKKSGFERDLAVGLYVFLNSTIVDLYYRQFGGHTQINASDLRALNYPTLEQLRSIGMSVTNFDLSQNQIDALIDKEINNMDNFNPILAQNKINEASEILTLLGMPKAQRNERSALTLLALLNLPPDENWENIERPMIGVTPIMDWCRETYKKDYAPNTRETFRRQTLHQFIDGGLITYNPDKPDRPVNSPNTCYQITSELYQVLQRFGTSSWDSEISSFKSRRKSLAQKYAKSRDMSMIPLKISESEEISLTPGKHSKLIHDIVSEFGPRFTPGAELLFIGDTGGKTAYFLKERLSSLGVDIDEHGKMPDVILFLEKENWLFLVEAVTSHGPVDSKRHRELSKLFSNAKPLLIYVSAFPDKKVMAGYITELSWETEVWISSSPTHMIHFNGEKFLGPHKK